MTEEGGIGLSMDKKSPGSKGMTILCTLCRNGPGHKGWMNQTGKAAVKKSWATFGALVNAPTQFTAEVAGGNLLSIHGL